jgi:hypothetical protein
MQAPPGVNAGSRAQVSTGEVHEVCLAAGVPMLVNMNNGNPKGGKGAPVLKASYNIRRTCSRLFLANPGASPPPASHADVCQPSPNPNPNPCRCLPA